MLESLNVSCEIIEHKVMFGTSLHLNAFSEYLLSRLMFSVNLE